MPAGRTAWLALVGLGLGPVGAAFLLWDIGMKQGNVPLLGVLSYASPIISTGLLVALGLAAADLGARRRLRADGAGGASSPRGQLTQRDASPDAAPRGDPGPCSQMKGQIPDGLAKRRLRALRGNAALLRRVACRCAGAGLLLLQPFGQQESQLQRLPGVEARVAAGVVLAGEVGLRDAVAPPVHSVTFWPVISMCTPPG